MKNLKNHNFNLTKWKKLFFKIINVLQFIRTKVGERCYF